MGYIEGFVVAVPAANKEAYRKHAEEALSYFKGLGVTRMVETWGDDVPDGKVTDFKGAVQAKPDEVVLFSWLEYPSKAVRDAANAKMTADHDMKEMGKDMPFDGQRMIFAGFEALVDEGKGDKPGYVDGTLIPVPLANKEAFRAWAARMAALFREHGATRVVDGWGDQIPDGKVTDFKRAVKAKDGETVIYGWVEWPSKEVRDAAWGKLMADPRMHADKDTPPLFDGQRMVYGGFAPILDA
ncbi:MAG TPA: DUF1428 domain-containing protein [Reyranella sp.]|nr:DUF1428 domain-containing protein [Reyranella sp.]